MPAQSPSYIARGDVPPSRFVKLNGTDHGIVVCGAGDEAIGISHEGTRQAPLEGVTPLAAKDGESCQVYSDTWPCEIWAGAAITAGQKLKPNAAGAAVPAVNGDVYSAIARASAASGERCKCQVTIGRMPPAA